MAQVMAWASACDAPASTDQTCNAWFSASANITCAACIQPPNNAVTGATIYDDNANWDVNYGGCTQLVDGNSTCATAVYQEQICHDNACNSQECVSSGAVAQACFTAADNGVCAAEANALAGPACPGNDPANTACSNDTQVVYVICGNGQ
jgi:hypothetical protein